MFSFPLIRNQSNTKIREKNFLFIANTNLILVYNQLTTDEKVLILAICRKRLLNRCILKMNCCPYRVFFSYTCNDRFSVGNFYDRALVAQS